jgi:hypothetical protein
VVSWGATQQIALADVAWLLDQLGERDARIEELEARRQRNKCMVAPP